APTPPDAAPVPAWWLAAILSCGLVVAVLVAVVLTVWAGPGDAPAPGSVDTGALGRRTDWDCATPADLTVRCSGPIGRGITGWHWRFDDGAVADGPTVEHDFDAPGPHAVALVIATPAGSRSAGKRSVEVPDPLVGAGTAAPDAGR
ncbi:MAG: PKD domain-containing protein, partial [Acidimicrobiales bacterium]